jgi:hypothetical protein
MSINWKNLVHDVVVISLAIGAIITIRFGLVYERDKRPAVAPPPPAEAMVPVAKVTVAPPPAPKPVVAKPVRRVVSPFCRAVKAFVAQDGQSAVESRARALGYSEAQIAAAKRCLHGQR